MTSCIPFLTRLLGKWRTRIVPLFLLLIVTGTLSAQNELTDDQVFVSGLRSRQLFELAEQFIAKRLADREISKVDQGNLVVELIRTRTAAAIQAQDSEREQKWNDSIAAGEDFLANRPHPRALVIRVQVELARLAGGKFLAQQLAAGIPGNDLRNRALQKISQARRGLEQIVRDIGQALPQANNGVQQDQLTAEELRALQKNVQYQIANCNMQVAKLIPESDSKNRIDALLQVMQKLDDVAQQTNSSLPLWWQIQLDRIESLRLQGNLSEAMTQLQNLSTPQILRNDIRRAAWLQQRIELALDSGRGDPVQLVEAARGIKISTPELDLALIRLMMQTGSNARVQTERDKWQQAASAMTQLVEQTHGAYWGRLAELAVIGDAGSGVESTPSSTNLDILIRVGDEAWRKKNYSDAVKAFDKAYGQAVTEGNIAVAMTAGMKAARIVEQQSRHQESGFRLIDIATSHSDHETAAAAHLRGCWNLGRAAATDSELSKKYAEQLAVHLSTWPESSSQSQARIWLGRYQGSKKQWAEAFETLIGVSAANPLLSEVATLLPVVANARLQELKDENQNVMTASRSMGQQMTEKLKEAGIGPNDRWTEATRNLLLTVVKFSLRYQLGDSVELSRLLTRALSESTDATDAWRSTASAWLVVAMAAKRETVAESIERVARLPADEKVIDECFGGLGYLKSTAESARLVELKLKLIEQVLTISNIPVGTKNRWLSRKSLILVEAGRGDEAVSMLQGLIQEQPRRGDLQVALARALTASQGKTDEALLQWRKVAAGSKQYSSNWFEAKYGVAKLLASSGKRQEAKALLDYLKIPPGWSQSKLSREFDALFSELDR